MLTKVPTRARRFLLQKRLHLVARSMQIMSIFDKCCYFFHIGTVILAIWIALLAARVHSQRSDLCSRHCVLHGVMFLCEKRTFKIIRKRDESKLAAVDIVSRERN